MRRELNSLARVGQARSGPFPEKWGAYGDRSTPLAEQMGGLNLQYGVTPDDAMLDKFIAMRGGYRNADAPVVRRPGGNSFSRPGVTANETGTLSRSDLGVKKPEPSKLDKLLAEVQAKVDKANAANDKRDLEVRGLLGKYGDPEGLYGRTMGEIDNFGKASKLDLEERAKQAMGAIQANLSARGLGNSTITSAFQQKNASDLAREQQRLSEMVSDRRITNDQSLTGNLAGFIERQNDIAPDMLPYLDLAMKYGESGDGQGMQGLPGGQQFQQFQQPGGGYQPMYDIPRYGPQGGGPIFLNGNPLQVAQGMFGGGGGYQPPAYYDQGYDAPADPMGLDPIAARRAREAAAKQARIQQRLAARKTKPYINPADANIF
jgi:hypothetical protein